MKAAPLLVAWHNDSAPIYSVHFEPHGKGRLATAGGDNNVRLWRVQSTGEDRNVTYLSTLVRHTQAVNVVRWCPRGEMLASAGDDGNVLLWVPSEAQVPIAYGGDDAPDDKETWHVKRMCRSSSGAEIYDLAWSPDGNFFVTGSMDNIARIYDAQTGTIVRQIAEHSHYVQGVAWDPLNEFLATQSSDRSVHVYALKTNDGQFSLSQHGRITKMDLPPRRRTSNSPAPPDFQTRGRLTSDASSQPIGSPAPSAPGTPASLALPMNPPPPAPSHSRRSSFGNGSPSFRRSASPAPSMPLPAVMPSASPNPHMPFGVRNTNIYANETLTSFFRRLTFAPDGSLLFTPAGQYKTSQHSNSDQAKQSEEVINTVYIYSRAGLNKPPIAHLPGHKKPSIAVKCSPIFYNLRLPAQTKQIAMDTSAGGEDIPPLPEPAHPTKRAPTSTATMEPPPTHRTALPATPTTAASPRPSSEADSNDLPTGPTPAFALPYRMVYAVATQDAVYVYDTQQQAPLCVVSNLHYATFTDLTWSSDGSTLLVSSSDGFASSLSFAAGELGSVYHGSLHTRVSQPAALSTLNMPSMSAANSTHTTPLPTPTTSMPTPPIPQSRKDAPSQPATAPSPLPPTAVRPASPTRSNSASSQSSFAQTPGPGVVISNPTPAYTKLPGVAVGSASNSSGPASSIPPPLTSPTPPMTPLPSSKADADAPAAVSSSGAEPASTLGKRAAEPVAKDKDKDGKKRRIAPTLVSGADGAPAQQSG